MATAVTGHSLEVRRRIPAPPAHVYDAWTTPALLTRWFSPTVDHAVVVHQVDARVGGHYRIEMRHVSGKSHIAIGEYREMDPPSRLSFTWRWEGSPMADSLVTLEFLDDRQGGTELVLTHSQFATVPERDNHLQGWTQCLGRLDALWPAS
jgi:uncharacterized protein YndB with AHSA1/START domain